MFSIDAFSGPQMTSSGGFLAWTPTRDAADLLIAAGVGVGSPNADWLAVGAAVIGSLVVAWVAFWLVAHRRS